MALCFLAQTGRAAGDNPRQNLDLDLDGNSPPGNNPSNSSTGSLGAQEQIHDGSLGDEKTNAPSTASTPQGDQDQNTSAIAQFLDGPNPRMGQNTGFPISMANPNAAAPSPFMQQNQQRMQQRLAQSSSGNAQLDAAFIEFIGTPGFEAAVRAMANNRRIMSNPSMATLLLGAAMQQHLQQQQLLPAQADPFDDISLSASEDGHYENCSCYEHCEVCNGYGRRDLKEEEARLGCDCGRIIHDFTKRPCELDSFEDEPLSCSACRCTACRGTGDAYPEDPFFDRT